jgi:pyruvate/2-oxoglutarate dehydrogenase complex dihydrolipoamide acyltransferase (E2) component
MQLAKEVGYVQSSLAAVPDFVSVDYDAAAMLAYLSSEKAVSFDVFKADYLVETSTMIAKKNPYIQAKEPGPAAPAITKSLVSVDYDAAVRLAYQASGELEFEVFKAKYLADASAMIAKKNPYVQVKEPAKAISVITESLTLASVDYDAAVRLAYEASGESEFEVFKAKYLADTSAMIAKKNPYVKAMELKPTSVNTSATRAAKNPYVTAEAVLPTPPVQDISAESFMKQPMVKVVTKSRPKTVVPKIPASPLARLLAEELGVELTNIGAGSGKNGKILVEDVRKFQRKIEDARRVISQKMPYFATANA